MSKRPKIIDSKRVKKNTRHSIIPTDIVNKANFVDKATIKRTTTSKKGNDKERSSSNNPRPSKARKMTNVSQIGNKHVSSSKNNIKTLKQVKVKQITFKKGKSNQKVKVSFFLPNFEFFLT